MASPSGTSASATAPRATAFPFTSPIRRATPSSSRGPPTESRRRLEVQGGPVRPPDRAARLLDRLEPRRRQRGGGPALARRVSRADLWHRRLPALRVAGCRGGGWHRAFR